MSIQFESVKSALKGKIFSSTTIVKTLFSNFKSDTRTFSIITSSV